MRGIERQVTRVLEGLTDRGGYAGALVCTDDGLLVAQAGAGALAAEQLAAFASLFDTVVERAARDLALPGVDEVTLLDASDHRLIVRPIAAGVEGRMFLVLRAARSATWRKLTNVACARLAPLLEPLLREGR